MTLKIAEKFMPNMKVLKLNIFGIFMPVSELLPCLFIPAGLKRFALKFSAGHWMPYK